MLDESYVIEEYDQESQLPPCPKQVSGKLNKATNGFPDVKKRTEILFFELIKSGVPIWCMTDAGKLICVKFKPIGRVRKSAFKNSESIGDLEKIKLTGVQVGEKDGDKESRVFPERRVSLSIKNVLKQSVIGSSKGHAILAEKDLVGILNSGDSAKFQYSKELEGSTWQSTVIPEWKKAISSIPVSGSGSWYHNSSDIIKNIVQKVYNENVASGSSVFSAGTGIAKWNPADIYYIGNVGSVSSSLSKKTGSLVVTDEMNDLFQSGSLVGVSLKKVQGEATVNKVEPRTFSDVEVAVPKVKGSEVSNVRNTVRADLYVTYGSKKNSGSTNSLKVQFDIRPVDPESIVKDSNGIESLSKAPTVEMHVYAMGSKVTAKQGQVNGFDKLNTFLGTKLDLENLNAAISASLGNNATVEKDVKDYDQNQLPLDEVELDEVEKDSIVRQVQVVAGKYIRDEVAKACAHGSAEQSNGKPIPGIQNLIPFVRSQYLSDTEKSCNYYLVH